MVIQPQVQVQHPTFTVFGHDMTDIEFRVVVQHPVPTLNGGIRRKDFDVSIDGSVIDSFNVQDDLSSTTFPISYTFPAPVDQFTIEFEYHKKLVIKSNVNKYGVPYISMYNFKIYATGTLFPTPAPLAPSSPPTEAPVINLGFCAQITGLFAPSDRIIQCGRLGCQYDPVTTNCVNVGFTPAPFVIPTEAPSAPPTGVPVSATTGLPCDAINILGGTNKQKQISCSSLLPSNRCTYSKATGCTPTTSWCPGFTSAATCPTLDCTWNGSSCVDTISG
jgi:hypothetical protein